MMSEFRPPRRLQVFAFDPSTARSFADSDARTVTITLPYELDPQELGKPFYGPRGKYVEVVDYDPASGAFYAPVNLNDDAVLFNDGLTPSPENPQFHQQMVYAVSMNTIAAFEEALGRVIQWAPTEVSENGETRYDFTRRLRIYPHALREANAYYNPDKKALLFGYFTAGPDSTSAPSGTTVFTCLSHDIIVHETVHAILDGLHPTFAEDSNPDMRALHEAFADIIALFQLFSFPSVLEGQIAKTRGDLSRQNLLGELAQEFGKAVGRGCALRDFLGGYNEHGVWVAQDPDPTKLRDADGPHARGAILVAAAFRAFLTIYKTRVGDLFRIASGGSGVLRDGTIDPDLKRRLAAEAAQCARRVMRICIRAMDYMPPVNVTFGDYLRAIVTADRDLFPEDTQGYRAAFIEAFASWGILPANLPTISEPALRWPTLAVAEADRQAMRGISEDMAWLDKIHSNLGLMLSQPRKMLSHLASPMIVDGKERRARYRRAVEQAEEESEHVGLLIHENLTRFNDASTTMTVRKTGPASTLKLDVNLLEVDDSRDREIGYHASAYYQRLLWLLMNSASSPRFAQLTGLTFSREAPATVRRSKITDLPSIHVAALRIARRQGQGGQPEREYVIEVIQSRRGYLDPERQAHEDARPPASEDADRSCDFLFRAGTTFLVDARSFRIRRLIRSAHPVDDPAGLAIARTYVDGTDAQAANAFHSGRSSRAAAFADLHHPPHIKDGFR
ncbi:gluzincin family metallopeptidase [Litoreibacter arenae]|uniref:Peptidase M4 n=1 Tax=Litoreibacter arenae DSM 19593 TaxID=1123360 RepID=S9QHA6_9RHOB|nr:hypothetical protein [Litoreibacter arenae]EPX78968.1 hypothetical protein thalar_01784 [Litoreibacter arenae DSM 19593]